MNLKVELVQPLAQASTPVDFIKAWLEGEVFVTTDPLAPDGLVIVSNDDTALLKDLGFTNIAIKASPKLIVFYKL